MGEGGLALHPGMHTMILTKDIHSPAHNTHTRLTPVCAPANCALAERYMRHGQSMEFIGCDVGVSIPHCPLACVVCL